MSTLREYQTKAVDQIEVAINAKQAPLYVLPTGGGKTVVATAIIERAAQAGQRVLVLTHRREILKQTAPYRRPNLGCDIQCLPERRAPHRR